MQDVELYDGSLGPSKKSVAEWQPSIGLLHWDSSFVPPLSSYDDPGMTANIPWCTATLISDKLVLTAGNCLDSDGGSWRTPRHRRDGSLVPLPPRELALLMHVRFNFQRDAAKCSSARDPSTCPLHAFDSYPVVRLVEHRRGKLNYAILELGPGADSKLAGRRYPPAKLDNSKAILAQAKLLTIVQHPNGGPKQTGSGSKFEISEGRIKYGDIDTLGGSGGAGIFEQSGRVIGLHTDGGCDTAGGTNKGLTIRAISRVSDIIE
jgi:hypothetical protein